jgi:hypothetical protein
MEYNGGSVVAMVGKGCVAIASDLRLGNQALGISSNFQKVSTHLDPMSSSHVNLLIDLSHHGSHIPWSPWLSHRCYHTVPHLILLTTNPRLTNTLGKNSSDTE